jgi:hypothetical protein
MPGSRILLAALPVWLLAVGAGFGLLLRYEHTPGGREAACPRWPTGSRVSPDPERATLVVAAHPHCPCTRATIEELAHIMTWCQGRVRAHVLFVRPASFAPGWERTGLWDRAAALPGVTVSCDEDGAEARRFGAVTSGHALLYGPDGRLLFSGGITGSRGHQGENAGRRAVIALLTEGAPGPSEAPVYGCPLHDPSSSEAEATNR